MWVIGFPGWTAVHPPLDIFSLILINAQQIAMKLWRTKVERLPSVLPDTGPPIIGPSMKSEPLKYKNSCKNHSFLRKKQILLKKKSILAVYLRCSWPNYTRTTQTGCLLRFQKPTFEIIEILDVNYFFKTQLSKVHIFPKKSGVKNVFFWTTQELHPGNFPDNKAKPWLTKILRWNPDTLAYLTHRIWMSFCV